MYEFEVKLFGVLGMFEHHFRNESAGLQIPTTLQLEQVTLRTDDRSIGETLEKAGLTGRTIRLVVALCHG